MRYEDGEQDFCSGAVHGCRLRWLIRSCLNFNSFWKRSLLKSISVICTTYRHLVKIEAIANIAVVTPQPDGCSELWIT